MRLSVRAVALCLVAVLALVVPASAVSDHGDPAISRLWVSGSPDRFACTVSYIFPRISDYGSWVITAGHCTVGRYLKRNASQTTTGVVNWRAVLQNHNEKLGPTTDIAIGTVPETRDKLKYLWLADKTPESGVVYIHGFPAGVERVSTGLVVPSSYADKYTLQVPIDPWGSTQEMKLSEYFKDTRLLLVKRGTIEGGSSGSPVLDEQGNVVGILWGLVTDKNGLEGPNTDDYDVAMFTPIERVHALMGLLGVK